MMKRAIFGATLIVALTGVATRADDLCHLSPTGQLDCYQTGNTPAPVPDPDPRPSPMVLPMRYLFIGADTAGVACYYYAATPGGIDTWGPNDSQVLAIITTLPACPGSNAAASLDPVGRAWEVYRSWQLARPSPGFAPPGHGITGLPTYLGVTADPLTHRELLPSGIALEVRAQVTGVRVDWGDGSPAATYSLAAAAGYPTGTASHTYLTKTCTADYRATHPAGDLCHPTFDAYPVTVTFTWTASYRYGGGWIELESVDLSATTPYDVDEVVGVLQP